MGDEVKVKGKGWTQLGHAEMSINWESLIRETEAIQEAEEAKDKRDQEQAVAILYRYSWDQTGPRRIIPQGIRFGTSESYPEPQWLMDAIDTEIDREIPFAIKDIIAWEAPL